MLFIQLLELSIGSKSPTMEKIPQPNNGTPGSRFFVLRILGDAGVIGLLDPAMKELSEKLKIPLRPGTSWSSTLFSMLVSRLL